MAQADILFSYLKENYQENEPIFLAEIAVSGMKNVVVRQQLKKLLEGGTIKRFDTGIYYIPKKTFFKSGTALSVDEVIKKKYLVDGENSCGYLSGILFANKLGLTTQVPMVYEVCSNKATTEYRDTQLGNFRVIVRKPYVEVNDQNVVALQFLDLMRDVIGISELEGAVLKERILRYLKAKELQFDTLKPFLKYYPDRIYKNMYEVGVLSGVVLN